MKAVLQEAMFLMQWVCLGSKLPEVLATHMWLLKLLCCFGSKGGMRGAARQPVGAGQR